MHTALQHRIAPASSSGVWRAACAWGLDLIQKACLSMPGIQASMSIFLYAGAPKSLVGMSCGESLQSALIRKQSDMHDLSLASAILHIKATLNKLHTVV